MPLHEIFEDAKLPTFIHGYKKVDQSQQCEYTPNKPVIPKTQIEIGMKITTRQDFDSIIIGEVVLINPAHVVIKRDDGKGHDNRGMFDNENYWRVDYENIYPIDVDWGVVSNFYTTKNNVSLGNIGSKTTNPITNRQNEEPDYTYGFHVCHSLKTARKYKTGNKIIKVKLTNIRVKGVERGTIVYVGDNVEILEVIE